MKLSVSTFWVIANTSSFISNELLMTQSCSLYTRTIDTRSVKLCHWTTHDWSTAGRCFYTKTTLDSLVGLLAHLRKTFQIRRTYVAATSVLTDKLSSSEEVAHFSYLLYKTRWNVTEGEKSALVYSAHSLDNATKPGTQVASLRVLGYPLDHSLIGNKVHRYGEYGGNMTTI